MNISPSLAKSYSSLFLLPAMIIFGVFFLLPTLMSFFFSTTRWTLVDWEFIGLENFAVFFSESSLSIGLVNTLIYAAVTCGLKVVFGFALAVLFTSGLKTTNLLRAIVFFPVLLSTIAVGITFSAIMNPTYGIVNTFLSWIGISGPDWLGDVNIALLSVALVDVWKGVGIAMVIFIAGINAIPRQYYEAMSIDGASWGRQLIRLTIPLSRPATNTVILLALIGGLRTFDLIWTMTQGGPAFATDIVTSIIYKQYQSGFYGLATAGNVILVLLISVLVFPLSKLLSRKEVEL